MENTTNWLPLESNPDVLNLYSKALGVRTATSYQFVDVYGFDPELLEFLPQPVIALVALFPVTAKYEEFRKQEQVSIEAAGQIVSPNCYFVKQYISNACGTIGLLHALCNNIEKLDVDPNGLLAKFLSKTRNQTPEERAKSLEQFTDLAKIHDESSQQGQTAAPSRDEEVDLHFICLIEKDGHIYELDGRKPWPINHGVSQRGLLLDGVEVIKKFMEREPDELQFTVMALSKS